MAKVSSEKEQIDSDLLTEDEKRILNDQLDTKPSAAGYFALYKYATSFDMICVFISILACSAGGVGGPLMFVVVGSLTGSFSNLAQGTGTQDFVHTAEHQVLNLVYIGVGQLVALTIGVYGFNYTGERITKRLQRSFLRAVLRQNVAFFDNTGAGEIAVRISNDMSLVRDGLSQKVGLIFFGIAGFCSAIIISFVKDWRLALVMLCVPLLIILLMGGLGSNIKRFQESANVGYAKSGSFAEEVISCIRNVTAYGSQARFLAKYEKILRSPESADFKAKFILAMMMASMFATISFTYGLAFWQGHRFLEQGHGSVGDLITVLFTSAIAGVLLGNAAPFLAAIFQAGAAATRIFATIERISPLDSMAEAGAHLDHVYGDIEFNNVKLAYPSRQNQLILDDFSLHIPAGKTVAVVGPSGSGKSTLLSLLSRFYSPLHGTIALDGHPITELNLRWLRSQIGYVTQDNFLFDASVQDNIAYGLGADYSQLDDETKFEKVQQAAQLANAHSFIQELPNGYLTRVGDRGSQLSGGQRQRIAIARAIISNPKILLLDEATSALDTESERLVQDALSSAAHGRTTLIVAHRLSTIRQADVIVVMDRGRLTEQGTHEDLMAANGAYAALVVAQQLRRDDQSDPAEEMKAALDDGAGPDRAAAATWISSQEQSSLEERGEEKSSFFNLARLVWSLNDTERHHLIIGVCISTIAGAGYPTIGIFVGNAVMSLIAPEQSTGGHSLDFWCAMFLMLGLVLFLAYATQGYFLASAGSRLSSRARARTFASILRQDIRFFDAKENSSGILTAFLSTEATKLTGISGNTLAALANGGMTIVSGIAIACSFGWKLGLVATSVMPILICCGFLRFWVVSHTERRFKRSTIAAAQACEAVSAIRTVASLTMEETILKQYAASLGTEHAENLLLDFSSAATYALSQTLIVLVNALLFWYGGTKLIGTGEYTVQQFFICYISVVFSAQGAGGLFSYAPEIAGAQEAALSLKRLMNAAPSIESSRQDTTEGHKQLEIQGDVELAHINFAYPTRLLSPALHDVSMAINQGQFIALVGGSGSGKSTVVSLLERFYDPNSGSITVDGNDLRNLDLSAYRKEVALVEQEAVLIGETIRECLLSDDEPVSDAAIEAACKAANIFDFVMSLPEGLDTPIGARGNRISGGQKQRLAIAKALLRKPKLLLLDEATSALDSESEKLVQSALESASSGRTTIAVAHRLSSIAHADCIFVFDHGQIVEFGNHEQLMKKRGRYFELVTLQDNSH